MTTTHPPPTLHRAVCALDCPGCCSLLVEIDNGRLLSVRGNPEHPFTQGTICGKVSRFAELQHGPRISTPLLRVGHKGEGRFRPASWEEAMGMMTDRFGEIIAKEGGEAILPYHYGGTMGLVQRQAPERLTHRAGFSRLDRNICYNIGWAGWQAGVGTAIGPDASEMVDSDLIILWGINAAVTHISLMGWVKKARKNGAKLLVVDPYRNHTARLADQHIAPKPGTDAALAVAMMQVMLAEGLADTPYLEQFTDFNDPLRAHLHTRTPEWAADITGLSPETIRAFARLYGHAKAPFLRIGLGMSRQRNGAVNLHAVSCLPALTGAWSKPGGGALFATGDAFKLNVEAIRQTTLMTTPSRILDMSRLGELLTNPQTNPPIRGLLVSHANPAGSCPDLHQVQAGLTRADLFTVVHEIVMTDTARFADLILPATTFLEHGDLYKSYGQYTLQYSPPLLPPHGEARCNIDVVNALAQRLGYQDAAFQWDTTELIRRLLDDSHLPALETWQATGWLSQAPTWRQRHFMDGFAKPEGRFHFMPGWNHPQMPAMPDHWPVNRRDIKSEADTYPLDFMTPPALDVLNTTFTGVTAAQKRRGPPTLWIHPQDAQQRGIIHGAPVQVSNHLGQLTLIAKVTEDTQPGLCLCESNHQANEFPEKISLNALSHADPVAPQGGAAFHDNRVEVRCV
ncbi:MAG: molybdopterin-dependent oxidoreductase [Magnetococcus sp. DMHC-6]